MELGQIKRQTLIKINYSFPHLLFKKTQKKHVRKKIKSMKGFNK